MSGNPIPNQKVADQSCDLFYDEVLAEFLHCHAVPQVGVGVELQQFLLFGRQRVGLGRVHRTDAHQVVAFGQVAHGK